MNPEKQERIARAIRKALPANEKCPMCGVVVEDWHTEWYESSQVRALYQGKAAMDCPVCQQPVGYVGAVVGLAPAGVPVLKRSVTKAADWASDPAHQTLENYIINQQGKQYHGYWSDDEIKQADSAQKGP
jgi:hypothetical protein